MVDGCQGWKKFAKDSGRRLARLLPQIWGFQKRRPEILSGPVGDVDDSDGIVRIVGVAALAGRALFQNGYFALKFPVSSMRRYTELLKQLNCRNRRYDDCFKPLFPFSSSLSAMPRHPNFHLDVVTAGRLVPEATRSVQLQHDIHGDIPLIRQLTWNHR
jgi:hypothetical protein